MNAFQKWFGISLPIKDRELEQSFFEKITEKKFRDGTFGLTNPQNEAAHSAKEIKRSKHAYTFTSISLAFKKVFHPYRDMQLIPWYQFVDGKPWLMPYAWIYRWIYCMGHKREQGIDLLTEPFLKKDIIEKRAQLLKA